jgi:transcriptional regulator with XRE-family HTH domain
MKRLPATVRLEARRLRQTEGYSLAEIGKRLDISPSTVRKYTADIDLTLEQLGRINGRRIAAARLASSAMAERFRRRRLEWQLEGRRRAREGDLLHQAGCLLYWAEGTKDRNTLRLVNSDENLLRMFRRFLAECFQIDPPQMAIRLNVYTGNGLTIREIEDHWLFALSLPRSCVRKHSVDKRPAATSGVKRNKLPYGTCGLEVRRSTRLVQHIYGAIQEYGGFDEPRWAD